MSSKIAKARKIMRDAFKKDAAFRMGYQSNIAMLIYDDQNHLSSLNLCSRKGCNDIANRIIKLIFADDS